MDRIQELKLSIMESDVLNESCKDYLMTITEMSKAEIGNAMATASVLGAGVSAAAGGISAILQQQKNMIQQDIALLCDRLKNEKNVEKRNQIKSRIDKKNLKLIEVEKKIKNANRTKLASIATAGVTGAAAVGYNMHRAKTATTQGVASVRNSVKEKFAKNQ